MRVGHEARRRAGGQDLRRIADVDQLRAGGVSRFAAMQAAYMRRSVTPTGGPRKTRPDIDGLAQSLGEDLQSPRRSHSARRGKPRRMCSGRSMPGAISARIGEDHGAGVSWSGLDRYAERSTKRSICGQLHGRRRFANRQHALASVASDLRLNLVGTTLAILLSALVAWLLARRIIGPVAAARRSPGASRGQTRRRHSARGADELARCSPHGTCATR